MGKPSDINSPFLELRGLFSVEQRQRTPRNFCSGAILLDRPEVENHFQNANLMIFEESCQDSFWECIFFP